MKKITVMMCIFAVLFSNMPSLHAEGENEGAVSDGEVIRELTDEEIEAQQKEMMDIYENTDDEDDEKTIIDVLGKEEEKKEEQLSAQEQEAVMLMKALGAIPDGVDMEHKLTRSEFAAALYCISGFSYTSQTALGTFSDVDGNTKYLSEISVLKDAGIVSGYPGGAFRPDDEINLEEASKMIVHMLGFDWQIGSGTDYYSLAVRNKIFQHVDALKYDSITCKQMAQVFLNVLETEIKDNSTYNINGLYMNEVLHIGKIEGVFEDDGRCDDVKRIVIDSVTFEQGEKDFSELLYRKVSAYYRTEDGVDTILSMTPYKKQNIIRIWDTEITGYSQREYRYEKDGARAKRAELETTFDFIYNGVKVTDGATENLMVPECGYAELIDFDNNGKFDNAVVWNYEPFVVDSYNENDMLLKSLNGKADIRLEKIPYDIYMAGSENVLSVDNIAYREYVVAVARSIGDKYVRMYLCEQITGTVSGTDGESVVIDGVRYGALKDIGLKAGDTGVFYANNSGMIIYHDKGMSLAEKYAYVIGTYINDDGEMCIRLFSQDSEMINAKISDNVRIDERRPKGTSGITVALDNAIESVIKYRLNRENEVTFIDTVNYNDDERNSINKAYEASGKIGFNSMLMALADNNYGVGKCPVTLDTIVFCVSEPYEKGKISVYDMTEYTKIYATGYQVDLGKLTVFNNDRDSEVGEVILNKRTWLGSGNTYSSGNIKSGAVITNISQCINDDGEQCYDITVERAPLSEKIRLSADAVLFESDSCTLSEGDIIKWRTDDEGMVQKDGLTVIYDCDKEKFYYTEGSSTYTKAMTNEAGRWHRMWAYKKDGDHLISYNQDLLPRDTFVESRRDEYSDYMYIDYTKDVSAYKTRVYVFDKTDSRLYEGSLADIGTFDRDAADCGEFIGFTSTGHRFFVVYR